MDREDAEQLGSLLEGTPYRALERIGGGGMGEIYRALSLAGHLPLVVKLLRADLLGHVELVDRMRLEGEVLALFSHRNIVAVRGYGKTRAGRPYIAMEQVEGTSLRQEMRARGALPVDEAIDIVIQLLSALAEVHAAGVVHRDVKPENIMIGPAPRGRIVKLLDFGVAKVTRRSPVAPLQFPTLQGACVGTPRYTAPEQAGGGEVDRRADIYAAGIVLYTLLAGRGPFDALKDPLRILQAHLIAPPDRPSQFCPIPLPPALETVVMRAIAKKPEDRFADAISFRRALAMILGARCIVVPPLLESAARTGSEQAALPPRLAPVRTDRPLATSWNRALAVAPAPPTGRAGPHPRGRGISKMRQQPPLSFVQVILSAAAFAAAFGGLAMWFIR